MLRLGTVRRGVASHVTVRLVKARFGKAGEASCVKALHGLSR